MSDPSERLSAWLRDHGVGRGDPVGLAIAPESGLGAAVSDHRISFRSASSIAHADATVGPRWVWWDRATADAIVASGASATRCWDVLTVHRLLRGGWRASIGEAWAWLHDLSSDDLPTMGQLDLLRAPSDEGIDPEDPVRPDGHLRPEWTSGGWSATGDRLAAWAALALSARDLQLRRIERRPDAERVRSTAHSESLADLLCAEMSSTGLPLDESEAESIISASVGERPTSLEHEDELRVERDAVVLAHAPAGPRPDLRNPSDVKSMLRRVSIDLPDTRAWRLEEHRDEHPLVDALLTWRKAERIATTYGYRWLDEHVGGGRLRGSWSSSDGAAGRMTATAGLHNLPAELRPAVCADPDHLFVRADLGQVEPRVLAAVSHDPVLTAATQSDDLYQPVADRLRVSRDIAKVAVLGAMYGATTGESAHALRRLEREYPVAMTFLEEAAERGRRGEELTTIGGRRIRMWIRDDIDGDIDRARQAAAARGRYARNALIQGAAAEFFKVWAAIVRARGREHGARIVLCLHDELLVHVPAAGATAAAASLRAALDEAAYRWSPSRDVRFTADVSVIERWSDAPH